MKNKKEAPDYVLDLYAYWNKTEDEATSKELYFIGKEIGAW
jgi:hypothetical protein